MTPERREYLEGELRDLIPGQRLSTTEDGHLFVTVKLYEQGIHTGNSRYLVGCVKCFALLHEATTGPLERIEQHLVEDERRRATTAKRFEEDIAKLVEPVPMRLHCPTCHLLHIDTGEFATKPHHTHACQNCGEVWRPAIVPTVGVRFLPGFRNEG